MFGVDMAKPGAQAYYDSIMALAASWEVDFVKIDDLSRPYHLPEIEAIRKAIDKTGRAIVLSTSPGATPVGQGGHVRQHANQWRISDDFWDNWSALQAQFQRLHDWTPYRGPGYFPDADMLPLGKLEGGSPSATGRSTYFTTNEQFALMSLWAITRSPLIHGGDMTQMDGFTLSLLTNAEVIAVNQFSTHNRQLFRTNNFIAWVADDVNSPDKYLALFNTSGSSSAIPVNLGLIGFTNACSIRSLWNKTDLGSFTGSFSPTLAAHRGQVYRLSGPTIPVPWLTEAQGGDQSVMLTWEPVATATSYRVKRATSEAGPYVIVVTGLTTTNYTDTGVQNGTGYYYVVSALVGGGESPNSGARLAIPAGIAGTVSWNFDRYGTIPGGGGRGGIEAVTNWNNSWPDNPTVNLRDHRGVPTTVDIIYHSFNSYSIQESHPGIDGDGSYNRELLNGYLNSGAGNVPTNSFVALTQIPFSYYDLIVYFSSDVAGRNGTVTDGRTRFSFSTIGPSSISGANAVLSRTTDAGNGFPSANYAVFTGLSGSSQNIQCHIPLYGGIAGFQIVPRPDPLPTAKLMIESTDTANVTLSWPVGLGSLVLQESEDLQTWSQAAVQPTSNSTVLPVELGPHFFRLTRP
jgi:hypothetical protein